ncbi:MAG: hypothetical protein ACSLFD_06035 [Solirubrobacterales bacterium]
MTVFETSNTLVADFSGRRIFHEDSARVVVAISDEAMAPAFRQHYATYGVDVEITPAALDQAAVESMIDEINDAVRSSRAAEQEPLVRASEPVPGFLTVTVGRGQLTEVERQVVDAAHRAPDRYRVEFTDHLPHGVETACDYTPDINCDTPLRGSVRISRDNATHTPNCTASFVVRSRVDDASYVLTAGHCRETDDVWARFAKR